MSVEEEIPESVSKIFEVQCIQENITIGKLVKEGTQPLLVDALAFIRSWKPASDFFIFMKRPKAGSILRCPRCNGMLSIEGSVSLNDEKLGESADGLIVGQFTIS
jgi:hypothetical protein